MRAHSSPFSVPQADTVSTPFPDVPPAASPTRAAWWFAIGAAVAAMAIRAAMQPILGDSLPFLLAAPIVVLVALRHGAAMGVLTALLCAAWASFPFLPPHVAAADLPFRVGGFIAAGVATALICAQFRRPQARTTISAAAAALPESALVRWLRAVVWGAALIPLVAYAAACWWGYQKAFSDAREGVVGINAVVAQHAEHTLAAAREIADRVQELVAMPDAELRDKSPELDQRLRDISIGLPSIAAISAWDERGRLLVSSTGTSGRAEKSIGDRAYFRELRSSGAPMVISGPITGRLTGQSIFNASFPRRGPGQPFGGVIVIALSPGYFIDFYRSLAAQERGPNSFSLFKADGALLARWPVSTPPAERVPETSPLLPPARAGQADGIFFMHSSFDTERRLISFKRLGDQPVYVTAGLSETAILAGWYRFVGLLSAILLPTAAVLVYVAWIALQKTRGEQAVAFELQDEMRRRAQAEQALVQAQKLEALGQLTGGVAHDFNNLLAVVGNSVELHRRLHPELAGAGPLAAISRAVDSGAKLVRQLLSFARRQALKTEVISLQRWLPDGASLVRTTMGSGTRLQLRVDPDTAPIRVDTAELELALINLAVNAKDAMGAGGVLSLSAGNAAPRAADASDVPMVFIRVGDDGAGIAPELLGKVFDPFFTTKAPGKGSGLGLSQVYGLCVQAGGTATIESEPGRGTTVTLLLPAVTSVADVEAPRADDVRQALSGHILLVEDNDDLAAAQAMLLKTVGFAVERAATADAALALIESTPTPFDVVVSDVVMPGPMDGIQLAFRLRETAPALPLILTTGYSARLDEAKAAGFRVLAKPVELDELLDELARHGRVAAQASAA